MNMTLVRGSLVVLLCMPVFVVGCGADQSGPGDDVVAEGSGDMLDDTANGPSERQLELANNIVRQYMQLWTLRDPVSALQMFNLGDSLELTGFDRNQAPDFSFAEARHIGPPCIDIDGDTISWTNCAVGPVSLTGSFKLNFTTIDVSMGIDGEILGYNTGSDFTAFMGVDDGVLDAAIGTGMNFGSLSIGVGLEMDDLEIAECGPTIGSITLSVSLGDTTGNLVLPFNGCG
jgi:hypothetical protein